MFGTKKRKVLIWSVTISLIICAACSPKEQSNYTISGNTQGTTYTIIIVDDGVQIAKQTIDSIFHSFDLVLSTYINESIISKINNADSIIQIEDQSAYFKRCYQKAMDVFEITSGAFDPSVFPLVEGWGFMKDMKTPLDSTQVDSLLQFVDFKEGDLHTASFTQNSILIEKSKNFKIDFNAIAQGLSVDVIDEFLQSKGLKNYYVEIGGELIVRGKNREGENWRIGIDTPIENQQSREIENILSLTDKAIATSGNYRKFYEVDGLKYSHTLDPKTGWPVRHSLLSATVVADNCTDADAYATAFMVLGVDATLSLIEEKELNLEVYLIYTNEDGTISHKFTSGFDKYLN